MQTSKFFKAKEIAPKTVMITGLGMENCYLLEGGGYALLIDTLTGAGDLKAFCRELTDKPIKVVNTHGHLDHCGGNFDFDCCYIHPDDIALMYSHVSLERRREFVNRSMANGKTDVILRGDDFPSAAPMITYPVYDGGIFDLGGREIEVIGVPGHSLGTVVLLDRESRTIFSGDACNVNTLLFLPGSASIVEYLEGLRHLKSFSPAYDRLYGGHGLNAVPPSIVDEAIELCVEIIEGKDDSVEDTFVSRPCYYGKRKSGDFRREDGKLANIAYSKDNIQTPKRSRTVKF